MLGATVALNVLSLALPLATLVVYDRILPNQSYDTLAVLALGLGGVLVLDGVLRSARAWISGWNAAQFEHAQGRAAVERVLAAPIEEIERVPPGEHLQRFAAIDPLREFHANQGPLILVDLPFAALFLAVVWAIGGWLVAAPAALLAVFVVVAWRLGLRLRRAIAERSIVDERRFSFLIELLTNVHTVKSYALEPQMLRRYERLADTTALRGHAVTFLSTLAQSAGAVIGNVAPIVVVLAGAASVLGGHLTIGALSACSLLAGRAVQPVLRLMGVWVAHQSVKASRARLKALHALRPERATGLPRAPVLSGSIKLSRVGLKSPAGTDVLRGIDLSILPGECVAVAGATGSGKSALLRVIGGIVRPSAGNVRFDGHDPWLLDGQSLRRQIGYLPQHAPLFEGTILDNLTAFRGGEFVDEALRLCAALGLDEALARLPRGLETRLVGGVDDMLPRGQRQAIAIVRALATRPRIVLFDETNSALDRRADGRLNDLLKSWRGERTLVIVSHRPSTLALADRRFQLVDGRLVPTGTGAPALQPGVLAEAAE